MRKRGKYGRPALDDGSRRDYSLHLRLTRGEYEMICRKADDAGIDNSSEFIRECILNASITPRLTPELLQALLGCKAELNLMRKSLSSLSSSDGLRTRLDAIAEELINVLK